MQNRPVLPVTDQDLEDLFSLYPMEPENYFGADAADRLKFLWGCMETAAEDLLIRFQDDPVRVKEYLSMQLQLPNTLQFCISDADSEEYPFKLEIRFLTEEKHKMVSKPLADLKSIASQISAEGLNTLLQPLLEMAASDTFYRRLLYTGKIDSPILLDRMESWKFLQRSRENRDEAIEYRIPAAWQKKRSGSVGFNAHLTAEDSGSRFSAQSLIKMRPSLVIDGQAVSEEELDKIASQEEGLYFLNGRWVVINPREIDRARKSMHDYEQDGLSLFEAMRIKAGMTVYNPDGYGAVITQDEWLDQWLSQLSHPVTNKNLPVPNSVKGNLFEYQKTGYSWLNMMEEVSLGACLADDMGLGKTLQVLALLQNHQNKNPEGRSLIVVPASLLMNWVKEAEKFTPELKLCVLHGQTEEKLKEKMEKSDDPVMVTTYALARKNKFLQDVDWEYLILDEAQAIKNPTVKQTRAVKDMKARYRIALTGTPIENDLSNLWSIFDFLNKGLLGSFDEFRQMAGKMEKDPKEYEKLHELVQPFLLRRVKTDKSIVADLPDKIEKKAYVQLTKRQTALYLREIKNLERILSNKSLNRITRAGQVLASITHFKQICNHPDQFVKGDAYKPADSGKFDVLKSICETIRDNKECCLVFTQYREIIPSLTGYLETVFGAPGLSIDGSTPVAKRQELVDSFNEQKSYIPFMVLSLKAGGTGLNLTRASHVIHFDRWWNPAVENQATDRAYRIGQDKNVIVHKIISAGTIEEHIDDLIDSKKELAERVIGSGSDKWITEMSSEELLDLVRLT